MDPRANWLLLANAALGNFLAGTASRIFAVSLPTVAASLDTTIVGIAWAVIAYQISQISLSLIFGRIGDIYGRHTLFGLGLVVSSIGALLCGLSQNVTQLILFRMFQGVGASMAQSQGRALAMEALPKESSGRAQGFMTTAFHSGVLLGPSAGGLIIDYIHWRAVFFFLIPIGLAGIVLTLINYWKGNVPRRSVSSESKGAIDYLGALLLIAATLTLISAIDYRIMESLAPPVRIALIVGFVLCFVGFIYREYTTASPILDLSLFRIRMFTLSALALLLVGVSQVMIGFLLPFYLQDVLHLKPTFIGLLFVSAPIFTVTLSPLVGWAVDKMGPRCAGDSRHCILGRGGVFRIVPAPRLALDRGGVRACLVGIGDGVIFYFESYSDDRFRARPASRRRHRRDLRYLRLGYDVWRFLGHAFTDGGLSLLQRRSYGHAVANESGGFCSIDEF